MQGDIVTAAKWLGASILLASGVLVGGLCWVRSKGPSAPSPRVLTPPGRAETLARPRESQVTLSRDPELDPSVRQAEGEQSLDPAGVCPDSPSEEEVWKKVPGSNNDSPPVYKTERTNPRISIEKIGEKVDPCKIYPLAGPCQLVHCHYKCTIYFDERYWSDHPIPFNHLDHRVEVVYIDKDRLRPCVVPAHDSVHP